MGLIDEYQAMVYPVLVGGGIPFFPQRERRVDLELVETRTFSSKSSTSATAWRASHEPPDRSGGALALVNNVRGNYCSSLSNGTNLSHGDHGRSVGACSASSPAHIAPSIRAITRSLV